MAIDNEWYFTEGDGWWDESDDSPNVMLRRCINPLRFSRFMTIAAGEYGEGFKGKKIIDIGCGGGYLSEELAKAGFDVTGIDPSPQLIDAAERHARKGGLSIRYAAGYGERLPFDDGAFDIAACCDVLEHVDDASKVIGEMARVLKPGGLFFFDTVNRTLASFLIVIKVAQDWRFTSWERPRTHEWRRFIRPAELFALMQCHGISPRGITGIGPGNTLVACYSAVRNRVKGKISFLEMGRRLKLSESRRTGISYMGHGIKA